MDRAAKLAAEAREYLELGPLCFLSPENALKATRKVLAVSAECLGFAPNEISAAVDQALTDAGTTP